MHSRSIAHAFTRDPDAADEDLVPQAAVLTTRLHHVQPATDVVTAQCTEEDVQGKADVNHNF